MSEISSEFLERLKKASGTGGGRTEMESLLAEVGEGIDVDFDALLAKRKYLREHLPMKDKWHFSDLLRIAAEQRHIAPEDLQRTVAQRILLRIRGEIGEKLETERFFPVQKLLDFDQYLEELDDVQALPQDILDRAGAYDAKTGMISIKMLPDGVYRLIDGLAHGSFPSSPQMYIHEKIHSVQKRPDASRLQERYKAVMREYGEFVVILATLTAVCSDKPLVMIPAWALLFASTKSARQEQTDRRIFEEVQAYKSEEASAPGKKLSDVISHTLTIPKSRPHLQRRVRPLVSVLRRPPYQFESKTATDRIIAASQSIDRLYALGYTVDEVGKMAEAARYSPQRRGYPSLENIIFDRCKEKNIRVEQLDLLADKRTIEREITLLTIAHIAREEVQKELG